MTGRLIQHSRELEVRQNPETILAVLTDFERYLPRWAAGPVAARKLTTGPIRKGTRFRVTAKVAGIRVSSPLRRNRT